MTREEEIMVHQTVDTVTRSIKELRMPTIRGSVDFIPILDAELLRIETAISELRGLLRTQPG